MHLQSGLQVPQPPSAWSPARPWSMLLGTGFAPCPCSPSPSSLPRHPRPHPPALHDGVSGLLGRAQHAVPRFLSFRKQEGEASTSLRPHHRVSITSARPPISSVTQKRILRGRDQDARCRFWGDLAVGGVGKLSEVPFGRAWNPFAGALFPSPDRPPRAPQCLPHCVRSGWPPRPLCLCHPDAARVGAHRSACDLHAPDVSVTDRKPWLGFLSQPTRPCSSSVIGACVCASALVLNAVCFRVWCQL